MLLQPIPERSEPSPTDKEQAFIDTVGVHPCKLHPSALGKKLSNKTGDYDALWDHYRNDHDIFVTLDTRDYFDIKKREEYKNRLNLLVRYPAEATELILSNSSF